MQSGSGGAAAGAALHVEGRKRPVRAVGPARSVAEQVQSAGAEASVAAVAADHMRASQSREGVGGTRLAAAAGCAGRVLAL